MTNFPRRLAKTNPVKILNKLSLFYLFDISDVIAIGEKEKLHFCFSTALFQFS